MAVRALIVAIEDYPNVQDGSLAQKLSGTLQTGLEFKAWLEQKWRTEGKGESQTQLIFCSEPLVPGHSGADRNSILSALLELRTSGQGATEELYFYFSGHGFSFVDRPGSRADIVISSDFKSADLSGPCCLNLDEMIYWLRTHLGPGRHYYFVDACRNKLDARTIQVGPLLPVDPQASGEASTFVLQSTMVGAVTSVGGPFPVALLIGLRGGGRAKVWDPHVNDAMFVRFDSLRQYLKTTIKTQPPFSRVEGQDGESDGVLATIRPIPLSKCTIQITNASSKDQGSLFVKRGRSAAEEKLSLESPSMVLNREPDIYSVSVLLKNATVEPSGAIPVDLYEDRTVIFNKIPGSPTEPGPGSEEQPFTPFKGGPPPPSTIEMIASATTASVKVMMPAATRFNLHNLETGENTRLEAPEELNLPLGRYLATLSGKDNRIFKRQEVELKIGEPITLNLTEWENSPPHAAIANKLPKQNGVVDFSESLGSGVADSDLNLWLALLGGARILGSQGKYSKLSQFPLHRFGDEPAGASPIYVLAGFEDPITKLQIGLSRNTHVTWVAATSPPSMQGIFESYFRINPGSHLISFRIGDQSPYTIASFAMPNRGMLITLTLDDEGNLRLSQYLLPLGHLLEQLPNEIRDRLRWRNHLKDVQFLAQANRTFRKRRNLLNEIPIEELEALLYAKWLDPIASTLAAYEFLRRGKVDELRGVVQNMKRFFPDFPDTQSLARLSGDRESLPSSVPLFLDGLRAFTDYTEWLPLPASHLDFTSPWTAWRAAVY